MEVSDKDIKYLEFIQANINRMAQSSFLIKGWAITLITALIAYLVTNNIQTDNLSRFLYFTFIIPIVLFWSTDAYYLHLERKFRGLYEEVVANLSINKGKTTKLFDMSIHKYKGFKYSIFYAAMSVSLLLIYIPIILIMLIFSFFLF